jgi:transposase InsO family protein
MYSTRSETVIRKLKVMLARHGIPEKVVSDNGPQYASREFADFAKSWDFKHTTSSPTYSQSNGLAEKGVQTAKHLLEKAKVDHRDPYFALLEYRNTPVDSNPPAGEIPTSPTTPGDRYVTRSGRSVKPRGILDI